MNEFSPRMIQRTNAELIEILTTERNKYQPLAIEAAELELKNRNLNPEHFLSIQHDLEKEQSKADNLNLKKASKTVRLINMIVDTICYFFLLFILLTVAVLVVNPKDVNSLNILTYSVLLVSFLVYYVTMETLFQKTIGKFITKSSVVTKDGSKPTFKNIVGRTFSRMVPFDNITFLFMENGIHDKFSETLVIKDKL